MGAHPDARDTVLGVQSASRDSERVGLGHSRSRKFACKVGCKVAHADPS